jgi:hypothetical protein
MRFLAALTLASQLVPAPSSSTGAKLIGHWDFGRASASGAVPPTAGSAAGSFAPDVAELRPLGVAGSNATALRLYGNGTGPGFSVPRDGAMDDAEEISIAMWLNFFWGGATLAKQHAFSIEFYPGLIVN